MTDAPAADDARSERRIFAAMLTGAAAMTVLAIILAQALGTPLGPQFKFAPASIVAGLAAVAPMAAMLHWMMRTRAPAAVKFREDQLDFFGSIGFAFTPRRIVVLAIAAGVSEELLFRGVAQTWIAERYAPLVAIIAPNIVFGLLHARSLAYALIAGIVGVYLGALYAFTDDLVAPIIAHGVYDLVALDATRRALAARRLLSYVADNGRAVD